ncbi:MAG: ABC-2 family transporter protein [Lachnospiraceae bacterium]|nr:ABC-2 family transporter protein [Lachnospiraceae bacterium]
MRDLFELYKEYASAGIKTRFQYGLDAFIVTMAVFVRESVCILAMAFTLMKFHNLDGWNIKEMMFLFSIMAITYGLLVAFFMVFRDLPDWIKHGDFDRILLRPRGIFLQIFLNGADWIAALAHELLGIILLIVSSICMGIDWNLSKIGYLILTIVSGALIQGAIFIFFSAFSFHIHEVAGLRHFVFWNSRKFATFPLSIYGKNIKFIFMFVFPFAFVNYFPSIHLLDKNGFMQGKSYLAYMQPVVAILSIGIACGFWKYSLKYYKSTGN